MKGNGVRKVFLGRGNNIIKGSEVSVEYVKGWKDLVVERERSGVGRKVLIKV